MNVCTQFDVLGDGCPTCGGWLHAVRHGGFPTATFTVCSEDCAADQHEVDAREHLLVRDMMCECGICTVAGRPSVAEKAEYAAYLAGKSGAT